MYGVQGREYRVQDTEYRVLSTEYRVQSTEYRVQGTREQSTRVLEYRVHAKDDSRETHSEGDFTSDDFTMVYTRGCLLEGCSLHYGLTGGWVQKFKGSYLL